MRVKDKLARAVRGVVMDDITDERQAAAVDAVLEGLVDALRDVEGGWTLKAERWLRDIRNGMR